MKYSRLVDAITVEVADKWHITRLAKERNAAGSVKRLPIREADVPRAATYARRQQRKIVVAVAVEIASDGQRIARDVCQRECEQVESAAVRKADAQWNAIRARIEQRHVGQSIGVEIGAGVAQAYHGAERDVEPEAAVPRWRVDSHRIAHRGDTGRFAEPDFKM